MKFNNINLQLFADPNTNVLHTGVYGTESYQVNPQLSVENKTFYDMTLIDTAQPQLVHDQFGQKRPIPKNGGKRIEFRQYASLPKALTPLTEGVTPDGSKLSATSIEAEVAQYGNYVTLSDMLDLTAIDNNVVEATKACGRQAGLTLDTITRNVLQACPNVWYAPKGDGTVIDSRSALDATCKLTVKTVKKVAAWFKAHNAPKIGDSYVCIIHPYAAFDLMEDPEWKYPHQYQDTSNLYEGEIGKVAGFRFVETSEALVLDGGVFSTLFIADGAYGVTEITGGGLQTIIKQLGSSGVADALDQRSSVGWKATKTAEILVPAYIVRVESKGELSEDAEIN